MCQLKSASRSFSNGLLEARLMLTDSGRLPSQGLVIVLSFSDVRENARAALGNLLDLIDDDGNIPLDPKSDALEGKVEQITKQGKTLMQSRSGESIRKGIPAVDILVDAVDNVVQVSGRRIVPVISPSYLSAGSSSSECWLAACRRRL